MTRIILTTLFSLFLSCSPSNNSGADSFDGIVSDFEQQLRKDIKDDGIKGSISAAIVSGDKIVWSKSFGLSDMQNIVLADTNTIYRTGSISKSFAAFLMMQLVEEGLLQLTDPVEKYLPEVRALKGYSDSTKITFLQLSTHTSGLAREPELEDAASGPIEHWEKKIIQSIPETSFESRPGEKFSYSNIGYGILGLSLSRAAGKPFIELVKDRIFVPFKMNSSYFRVPDDARARLAKGIDGGPFGELDVETPRIEHDGRGYKVPNGGIYSTPNDLARFIMANMGYQSLLKPETLEMMQTDNASDADGYGLGFFITDGNGMTIIEHGGSVSGYTAQLAFDRSSKYGVIIMRNYNWGITDLSLRSHMLLRDLSKLQTERK